MSLFSKLFMRSKSELGEVIGLLHKANEEVRLLTKENALLLDFVFKISGCNIKLMGVEEKRIALAKYLEQLDDLLTSKTRYATGRKVYIDKINALEKEVALLLDKVADQRARLKHADLTRNVGGE